MPRVWQIAAGEAGRRYADLFLRHDIILQGPGDFGPFEEQRYNEPAVRKLYSGSRIGALRRFAKEVTPGDVVLLRAGYRVVALGVVAEPGYFFEPRFDDIYDWELQHCQRVIWQDQLSSELEAIQATTELFADRKQIPTFTAVADARVREPVAHLLPLCQNRPLRELPSAPPPPLTLEELSEALFARGLSYDAVRRLRGTLEKQRRLLDWYDSSGLTGGRPTEHEVVAHVILPLLLALGWSEQLLAVEWRLIDLVVFSGTPTDEPRCRLVCEAKSIGHGLQNVRAQAVGYTESLGLSACEKILLADGGRFYLISPA